MVFEVPDWDECSPKKNTVSKNKNPKKRASPKASPKKGKLNGVADRSKLISKENKHTKKVKQANKHKKNNSDSSFKAENIDTDKLDEVILNAKKKKFNESLVRDDVEDLLFKEEKSPKVVTPDEKKKLYMEKKPKNMKSNIVKKSNKSYLETKPIVDKEVFKIKDNINNNIDSSKPSQVLTNQERKKKNIKLMLENASNRNTINIPRNKLRERMLDRLKSAQFRFLNEKLYTSSGSEARQLFQEDPAAFQVYHQGYQQQVKKWPVNPLDVIVKRIQKMPKSHVIADMGCGEAALAQRLAHHTVRSFDLVANSPGVEACDMAHTPLLAASVDVVVYCLALMGNQLTQYLLEANRVLKLGGHLLIAEVESRFTDVNAFTKDVQRLGFKLKNVDSTNQVFLFMEFLKNTDPPVKKAKLPVLTLKPCIYKRR